MQRERQAPQPDRLRAGGRDGFESQGASQQGDPRRIRARQRTAARSRCRSTRPRRSPFPRAEEGAARFAGAFAGPIYTRLGNPTVAALERCVAELEGGCGAVGTATGMGGDEHRAARAAPAGRPRRRRRTRSTGRRGSCSSSDLGALRGRVDLRPGRGPGGARRRGAPETRGSSASRRPPTRRSTSSTSRRPRPPPTTPECRWWSTTRSPARTSSARSSSGPTSSCTR